jgi:uncharacterized protein YqhQ
VSEEILLGGQAVIEGVMMRSPGAYAVAVRRPAGDVVTFRREIVRLSDRSRILRLPVLRGVLALAQSLALGIRALNFSAGQALETEARPGEAGGGSWAVASSMVLALTFAVGLFFFLPLLLADALGRLVPALAAGVGFNLAEGVIRIALFLLYLFGLSRFADMRRVFEYHGAEHKVVSTFEAGEELTVENARRHSTFHPRCGTSFLLFVMVVSILVFSLVPGSAPFSLRLLARILLLPLVAGGSFELLRASARGRRNPIYAAVVAPGLWLQRLTTREPADDQLSVAIQALRAAFGDRPPERREAFPL